MYVRPYVSPLKNVRLPGDPALKVAVSAVASGQGGALIPRLTLTLTSPLGNISTLPPIVGHLELVSVHPYPAGQAPDDWMDVPYYLSTQELDTPPDLLDPWKYSTGDVLSAVDAARQFLRSAYARWVNDSYYAVCSDPVTGKDTTLSYSDWYYSHLYYLTNEEARVREWELEKGLQALREVWDKQQSAALEAGVLRNRISWSLPVQHTNPVRPGGSVLPDSVVLSLPCGLAASCTAAIPSESVDPVAATEFVFSVLPLGSPEGAPLNPKWFSNFVQQSGIEGVPAGLEVWATGGYGVKFKGLKAPLEFVPVPGVMVWFGGLAAKHAPTSPGSADQTVLALRVELGRQFVEALEQWMCGESGVEEDFQDWYRAHLLIRAYRSAREQDLRAITLLQDLWRVLDARDLHDLRIRLHNEAEEFEHPPEEPEDDPPLLTTGG